MKTTLGNNRLGSGGKMKVETKGFKKSNFNENLTLKTTASAGTLIPFFTKVGLNGTDFDIKLDCDVLTLPTLGPLFGSYKIQLDVFKIPLRLYNAQLFTDKLNIGMNMKNVPFPQIRLKGNTIHGDYNIPDVDNWQINPSSLMSYLGVRGIGTDSNLSTDEVFRDFNATSLLAYFDIFKQYYANKQEEKAFIIHNDLEGNTYAPDVVEININGTENELVEGQTALNNTTESQCYEANVNDDITIQLTDDISPEAFDPSRLTLYYGRIVFGNPISTLTVARTGEEAFSIWNYDDTNDKWVGTGHVLPQNIEYNYFFIGWNYDNEIQTIGENEPKLKEFDLDKIDTMRELILQHSQAGFPMVLGVGDYENVEPYTFMLKKASDTPTNFYSILSDQEGLLVKTYQSDLFNNWLNTESIDGDNGVNELSKVLITTDVESYFTIDELNIQSKIYRMLNRISVSGGSFYDWQEAVYSQTVSRKPNNPVYQGSLIKELGFQSVISNSETQTQPLGTLGGRGIVTNKHKGGYIKVKCTEPCLVMGIFSLTPRIDYSQGNDWHMLLETMDDLHKPDLDSIGFQDLITDKMAWWSTDVNTTTGEAKFTSAGKQPSWIDYQTSVDVVKGNFAKINDSMFMTLNRRYEPKITNEAGFTSVSIKDLTTYIDPKKFNHIFAYTRRDAMNFWVQIQAKIQSRRVMSNNVMPQL
jgi:hypothetical protein